MLKEKDKQKIGTLLCVLGAISWGISGACSEALFKAYTLNAIWVTAIRMAASGAVLILWLGIKQRGKALDIFKDKKSCIEIIAFSMAGLVLCQVAYLSAIKWTNSGTATILQNLSIVLIAIFVSITTRKLPKKKQGMAIILALIGIWLIATGGELGNMKLTKWGLFWGILSAFGAASYSLLSRAPVKKWGSLTVTTWGMVIGGSFLFITSKAWQIPEGLGLYGYILLAIIVLVGTVGAFLFFLEGISLVGPVTAILLGCLEPVVATLLSTFWLGSSFTAIDFIGFACIMVTVFLLKE